MSMFPEADVRGKVCGWKLDYGFIRLVNLSLFERHSVDLTEEETESVLLTIQQIATQIIRESEEE
jgi:hypothetical protein